MKAIGWVDVVDDAAFGVRQARCVVRAKSFAAASRAAEAAGLGKIRKAYSAETRNPDELAVLGDSEGVVFARRVGDLTGPYRRVEGMRYVG